MDFLYYLSSLYIFLVSISFYSNIFFISFFLLALGLVCPSFSSFLSWKVKLLICFQCKQILLGTMRLQVWSVPLLSGLRIRHCRELWCRSQIRLRSRLAVALV